MSLRPGDNLALRAAFTLPLKLVLKRAIFKDSSELQRGNKDTNVKCSNGPLHDACASFPRASIQLHTTRWSLSHHYVSHVRPYRLRGDVPSLQG
ncbi:hypothetical protein F2Q69_00000823 [Brassica cretica]|uniref:Uncharacterized protein n=1 Tax=Brassica cretica TaxID=69181 RepID=A0A8S9P691_BRACR|nr:hypothetical protein F2Q69_00000823 [Brassica cretica]